MHPGIRTSSYNFLFHANHLKYNNVTLNTDDTQISLAKATHHVEPTSH